MGVKEADILRDLFERRKEPWGRENGVVISFDNMTFFSLPFYLLLPDLSPESLLNLKVFFFNNQWTVKLALQAVLRTYVLSI